MADTRISDLTAATALADADLVPIVQAGETKKLTGSALKTYTSGDRALAATTISAGTGLTGGGDLSANRTLALDTGAAAANLGYTPEDVANKDEAGGYAGLDGSGKISTSALPDLAVSEYLGAIANETNMLALTGQKGDWVNRTDLGTVFIITGNDPSVLSDWTQLNYPTAPVTSVDGQTGSVDLSTVYQPLDSALTAFAAKSAPTGDVVGTTDTQTLANKTLEGYAVKATSNAASLGSELVTNGTFTGSATGWTLGTNWAYGTNNVVLTLDAATEGDLTQTLSGIEAGATYQVSWTQRHSVADNGGIYVFIGTAFFGSLIRYSNTTTNTVVATITASASGSLALKFTPVDATSTGTITIDAVAVKKVTPITACEISYDNSNAVNNEARRTTATTANYFEGKYAGQSSYSGFSNVAIGTNALKNVYSGSFNIAIGGDALTNVVNGSANTAVGPTALNLTLSNYNVGIGRYALSKNSTGSNNIGIGYQSGVTDVADNACVSASNCVFIGYQSGFATSTNYSAATAIGYLAKVSSANTVVLGRTTDVTVLGATADDGSGNRLQVTGGIKATTIVKTGSYTVATLPSASTSGAGARAFVTDANSTTFLATAVGGGANAVPVVSNGTSWVIG